MNWRLTLLERHVCSKDQVSVFFPCDKNCYVEDTAHHVEPKPHNLGRGKDLLKYASSGQSSEGSMERQRMPRS